MRLLLTVDGDIEATELLRQFLAEDLNVQRAGDMQYGRPADSEHLGVDVQVLSVAISSTLTSIGLVMQVLNFRRSRPDRPVITITRESADGTVVRVESDDPDAAAEIARKLENG